MHSRADICHDEVLNGSCLILFRRRIAVPTVLLSVADHREMLCMVSVASRRSARCLGGA